MLRRPSVSLPGREIFPSRNSGRRYDSRPRKDALGRRTPDRNSSRKNYLELGLWAWKLALQVVPSAETSSCPVGGEVVDGQEASAISEPAGGD